MKDPYQKFHFGSIKSKLTRFGLVVLVKQQIADIVKMLISSVQFQISLQVQLLIVTIQSVQEMSHPVCGLKVLMKFQTNNSPPDTANYFIGALGLKHRNTLFSFSWSILYTKQSVFSPLSMQWNSCISLIYALTLKLVTNFHLTARHNMVLPTFWHHRYHHICSYKSKRECHCQVIMPLI